MLPWLLHPSVGVQQVQNRSKDAALRYSSTNIFKVKVFFPIFDSEVMSVIYKRRIRLICCGKHFCNLYSRPWCYNRLFIFQGSFNYTDDPMYLIYGWMYVVKFKLMRWDKPLFLINPGVLGAKVVSDGVGHFGRYYRLNYRAIFIGDLRKMRLESIC